jgi:hypothetical protein
MNKISILEASICIGKEDTRLSSIFLYSNAQIPNFRPLSGRRDEFHVPGCEPVAGVVDHVFALKVGMDKHLNLQLCDLSLEKNLHREYVSQPLLKDHLVGGP